MKQEIKLIVLVLLLVVGPAVGVSLLAARILGNWQVVLQKRMEGDAAHALELAMQAWEREKSAIQDQVGGALLSPHRMAQVLLAHPWIGSLFVFQPGRGLVYPPVETRDSDYIPPALKESVDKDEALDDPVRHPDEGFYTDLVTLKSRAERAEGLHETEKATSLRNEIMKVVLERYDRIAPLQRDLMVEWLDPGWRNLENDAVMRNSRKDRWTPRPASLPSGRIGELGGSAASPTVASGRGVEGEQAAGELPQVGQSALAIEWRERMKGRCLDDERRLVLAKSCERLMPAVDNGGWIRAKVDSRDVMACVVTAAKSGPAMLLIEPDGARLMDHLAHLGGAAEGLAAIRIEPVIQQAALPPLCLASQRFSPPLETMILVARPSDTQSFLANARLQSRLYRLGGILLMISLVAGAWLIWRVTVSEIRRARERSEFAAAVSHDLRTPLASMRMLAESLYMGSISDESKRGKFLGAIVRESDRLSRLTDRALFFIRYGEGALRYRLTEGDLGVLVKEAVDSFAVSNNVQPPPIVEMAEAVPPVLYDSGAMEQVVYNLLDNAVKYSGTENGSRIEVSLYQREVTRWHKGRHEVVLSVRDHGMGMSREEMRRVLRPYARGKGAMKRNARGIGLGLALCHHVVKAHGGRLEIESEPGKGSIFRIVLPALIRHSIGENGRNT